MQLKKSHSQEQQNHKDTLLYKYNKNVQEFLEKLQNAPEQKESYPCSRRRRQTL